MGETLRLPSLKEAEPLVALIPPDNHGLTILPFISGERSPGWHAEARAVIAGIHTNTTPEDLLRASMEALAYQLGEVYQEVSVALDVKETRPRLVGSGGALLSTSTLRQIVSDTLGTPLYPSYELEASARGVALLALAALGLLPDVGQVQPRLADPVQPDAKRGEIYQQAAIRQMQLYKALLGSIAEI